ncbi:MAG: glycosyltransferase [Luteitalea sp.]|nr:glycosyltransferase [Luteitalea sp.]
MAAMSLRRPVIVLVRPWTRSIAYRPYLERIHSGRLLLDWCVERIGLQTDAPVYLMYSRASDEDCLAHVVPHLPVITAPTDLTPGLESLWALVQQIGLDDCIVADIELAFAPGGLIAELEAFHDAGGYTTSTVAGLPPMVAPDLLSRPLLKGLMELQVPDLPSHPRTALDLVERAQTAFDLGLSFRRGRLTPHGQISGGVMPSEVSIHASGDVEIARGVIEATDGASQQVSLLQLWRHQATERKGRHLSSWRSRHRSLPHDPKRVLYVSNPSACSGAEESLCQVVAHLDRDRYCAAGLVAMDGEFVSRMRPSTDVMFVRNQEFASSSLCNYRYVRSVLQEWAPNLIHNNGDSGTPLLIAASELQIPMVQHVRVVNLSSWRETLDSATKVIAVSHFIKHRVVACDVDENAVKVIYDGVDVSRFAPDVIARADARRRLQLPASLRTVLIIARFVANKRHDLLIRAIAELNRRHLSVHLLCVGEAMPNDRTYGQTLALVHELDLREQVTFAGFLADVRLAMAAADVLVLCSDYEPLGTCVLEAMAMGLPVVVTRAGGLVELLTHSGGGMLVDTSDVAALTRALDTILTDRCYARQLADAGLAYVRAHLTSSSTARDTMLLYDEVLDLETG